jgi:hypothetical protein
MQWREDRDDELRREAIAHRRAMRRAHVCQCGDDLPGHCPGPAACPYSDFNTDEEAEDDADE